MGNFARIIDGIAVDVSPTPATSFHPDIASQFVAVPGQVKTMWRRIDGNWLPPEEVAPSAPSMAIDRRITRFAFRKRFTREEKVRIEMASLDNPEASINERQQAAALRVDLRDSDSASFVDLAKPETRDPVLELELAGLLGPGRSAQILDDPVQDHERLEVV